MSPWRIRSVDLPGKVTFAGFGSRFLLIGSSEGQVEICEDVPPWLSIGKFIIPHKSEDSILGVVVVDESVVVA